MQGAIDELCNMANSKITTYDFGPPTSSIPVDFQEAIKFSGSHNFIRKQGNQFSVCIYKNGGLSCFKNNNYLNEKAHLKELFGENNCVEYNNYYSCTNNYSFTCEVYSNGYVYCSDDSIFSQRSVESDNSADCRK